MYINLGGSHMGTYICKNLCNWTVKMYPIYVRYTPILRKTNKQKVKAKEKEKGISCYKLESSASNMYHTMSLPYMKPSRTSPSFQNDLQTLYLACKVKLFTWPVYPGPCLPWQTLYSSPVFHFLLLSALQPP